MKGKERRKKGGLVKDVKCKNKAIAGIMLIALVIAILFSYDE